jgi:integrase
MTSISGLGNFTYLGPCKLRIVKPKTSSSRRTVVLPRLAVSHLQEHKKRQNAERRALGDAWREHRLVFASSIGTPIEPRNVNRRWDELRRRAGLDWLRLHDLRHGCATLLLAKATLAASMPVQVRC